MRKFIIIILLALGAVAYFYYFHEDQTNDHEIVLYGNVDIRQVNLGFRISGRVTDMLFEEGDFVKAGALMGILDNQPYFDEVAQNEAVLESAKASLSNATLIFNRRSELIGDGSISKEDFDNANTAMLVQEANLKNIEAAASVSRFNLSFTKVYAPVDGTVLTRIREPGTVVLPGDPIYTLSITSPVWVRAFIPEKFLGQVFPGMKAHIFTDTPNGKKYSGKVGFISPVAEFTPKTVESSELRTDLVYRLRIYADNPDLGLRQGMPVTVKLQKNDRPENQSTNKTPENNPKQLPKPKANMDIK